jgi:hypothetical protein
MAANLEKPDQFSNQTEHSNGEDSDQEHKLPGELPASGRVSRVHGDASGVVCA